MPNVLVTADGKVAILDPNGKVLHNMIIERESPTRYRIDLIDGGHPSPIGRFEIRDFGNGWGVTAESDHVAGYIRPAILGGEWLAALAKTGTDPTSARLW